MWLPLTLHFQLLNLVTQSLSLMTIASSPLRMWWNDVISLWQASSCAVITVSKVYFRWVLQLQSSEHFHQSSTCDTYNISSTSSVFLHPCVSLMFSRGICAMKSSPAGKIITIIIQCEQCLVAHMANHWSFILHNLSLAGFGDHFKKLQLQVFVITHATITL